MQSSLHIAHSCADISGVRLAYDRAGQGPSVVLLHGALLDSRMWDGQFGHFAGQFDTVRYDLRGAGQSETQPSAEPFAHHAEAFLRAT